MPTDILLTLTARERKLIAKYGYPFPEAQSQLEAFAKSRKDEVIVIAPYYLEVMLGDLVYSMRKTRSTALCEELDALCKSLEYESRRHGRVSGSDSAGID